VHAGFSFNLPNQVVESQFRLQVGSIAADMNASQNDLGIAGGNKRRDLLLNFIGVR
jgi:hypothetical protein